MSITVSGVLLVAAALGCVVAAPTARSSPADSTGCACVTLRDTSGTKPLGCANVVALGLHKGAMSDSVGFARICGLPSGLVRLKANMLGYWPGIDSLVVHPGGCDSLVMRLQRSPVVPEYIRFGPPRQPITR
jgi:hypothetical protein